MNDKIRANKGQIQNYNLFSNPVIHEVGMYLKDKKILTHYFERLQNLFEDNDALDQSKKKSQVRFGLTPDEFKDQQDKKMQLQLKLAKLEYSFFLNVRNDNDLGSSIQEEKTDSKAFMR